MGSQQILWCAMVVGVLIACPACADKTPAIIEIQVPSVVISSSEDVKVKALVRNKTGVELTEIVASLAMSPADSVRMNGSGAFRCLKSGMVTVTASAGSVTQAAQVNCDVGPAAIALGMPKTIYSRDEEVAVTTQVTNKSGEVLADVVPTLAVAPSEVALVTQAGKIRCMRSGKAAVTAAVGALTKEEPLSCNILQTLTAPLAVRVILGHDPVPTGVTAMNRAGEEIIDIPLDVKVAPPGVLNVKDGKYEGIALGTATVTYTYGDKTATTTVYVVREFKNEPVLLNDGSRFNQTLTKGSYEVEIEVRGGEVTLDWVGGAAGCVGAGKSTRIRRTCTIPVSGSVIVSNPSFLGLGSGKSDGIMRIYEVPVDYEDKVLIGSAGY